MEGTSNIVFYQAEPGNTQIEVKLENDTVWLTQSQIVDLFQSSKANISEHIKHIFKSGELEADSTVREIRTVQQEGKRLINRNLEQYSLDMIISIGYRVNSIRGTQFRIWANQVLKEYLVEGYAIDKKRFQEQSRQLDELKQTVKLLGNVIESKALNSEEATGLLKVVTDYAYALDVLGRGGAVPHQPHQQATVKPRADAPRAGISPCRVSARIAELCSTRGGSDPARALGPGTRGKEGRR